MSSWMLYGAYGFTGRLLVDEALRRGHRPLLAGRDGTRLAALAKPHGLEWLAIDLEETKRLAAAVEQFDLVFHAAGPFAQTSEPVVRACLAGQTHYLDITGELPVYENTFRHHDEAVARGIALLSGVGYDIIPSDCLAAYVAARLPGATHLETAIHALARVSSGTVKSGLVNFRQLPGGSAIRRDGRLVARPLGSDTRTVRFSDGRERTVTAFPWGDLVTAYHTTGIPNITSYLALPSVPGFSLLSRVGMAALRLPGARALAERAAPVFFTGPDEQEQRTGRTYLWARAADEAGHAIEAWLETGETYRFTALAGVRAVERVLDGIPSGALTPAKAFGVDFVLEIDGVKRYDALSLT